MYEKLRSEIDQRELLHLHSEGVSIVDAWIDCDPEGQPDDLELLRRSKNIIVIERIERARQALLKLLRNENRFAIGRSSLRILGQDQYEIVPPKLCRLDYIDWSTGSIKNNQRSFSIVSVVSRELIEKSGSSAIASPPENMLSLIDQSTPPGVRVLIQYMIEHGDWDGVLRAPLVKELNGLLSNGYGGAPYFRGPVDRKSWSNYKKELRKEVEKSGKSYLKKWK